MLFKKFNAFSALTLAAILLGSAFSAPSWAMLGEDQDEPFTITSREHLIAFERDIEEFHQELRHPRRPAEEKVYGQGLTELKPRPSIIASLQYKY